MIIYIYILYIKCWYSDNIIWVLMMHRYVSAAVISCLQTFILSWSLLDHIVYNISNNHNLCKVFLCIKAFFGVTRVLIYHNAQIERYKRYIIASRYIYREMFGYLITQIDYHITQHRTNHYVKLHFLRLSVVTYISSSKIAQNTCHLLKVVGTFWTVALRGWGSVKLWKYSRMV
jgi:hypothetical protein